MRNEKRGENLYQRRGKRPHITMRNVRRTPIGVAGLLFVLLLAGCGVTNVSGHGDDGGAAQATATAQATPKVRMTITTTEQGTLASNGTLAAAATITNATGRAIHLVRPGCIEPLLGVALFVAAGPPIWSSQGYIVCGGAGKGSLYDDMRTVGVDATTTVNISGSWLTPHQAFSPAEEPLTLRDDNAQCQDIVNIDRKPLHVGQTYTVQAQILWRYQAGSASGPEAPQCVAAQTSITLR